MCWCGIIASFSVVKPYAIHVLILSRIVWQGSCNPFSVRVWSAYSPRKSLDFIPLRLQSEARIYFYIMHTRKYMCAASIMNECYENAVSCTKYKNVGEREKSVVTA